jgi:hypothetical protein
MNKHRRYGMGNGSVDSQTWTTVQFIIRWAEFLTCQEGESGRLTSRHSTVSSDVFLTSKAIRFYTNRHCTITLCSISINNPPLSLSRS